MDIKIKNSVFCYNGKKIPLISGEFHYWRDFKENWEPILNSIRDMGLNVISTYIPWNYHEIQEGKYDFEGKTSPQKDLRGFIELTIKKEFYLIARPGPYIYSEWPFGGVPERATKYHRLDPVFLKMSKNYIDNVCKILEPYQITKGGNIIMLQADNEPYPPIESFGNEMGCFSKNGMFKEWIKEKYKNNLDLVNKKWKTRYKSFEDINFYFHEPYVNTSLLMAERLLPYPDYYMRYVDSMEFVGWYGTEIVKNVAGWMRDNNIDVPCYANGWSPEYQDFNSLQQAVEVVGSDIYPAGPFIEGDKQTEDEWFYVMNILKMHEAEAKNKNVWCAEYQSGAYPLKLLGYVPAQHFKFVYTTLMAKGLKGWNWYMLVNRDNWNNCPINEWGIKGEYFEAHKEAVEIANRIKIWDLDPLYDISLFAYKPHKIISPGNFKQVFNCLEEAGVNFNYFEPYAKDKPDTNCFVYAGSNWIEKQVEEKILRFIKEGGTAIFFNQFPSFDEYQQKLEKIPLQEPDGARPVNLPVTIQYKNGSAEIKNAGHLGCKVNFFFYNKVEGTPIFLNLSTKTKEVLVDLGASKESRFIIGYKRNLGKGKIIHIGSNPSAILLDLIIEQEGIGKYSYCNENKIATAVHKNKKGGIYLFVINKNETSKTATVFLNFTKLGIKNSEVKNPFYNSNSKSFNIPVKGKDVAILKIDIQ